MPLEFRYGTLEKSSTILAVPAASSRYLPRMASSEPLVMSPSKRIAARSPLCSTVVIVCATMSVFVPFQMNHQPGVTAVLFAAVLHFIHQRLNEEHPHAARTFFAQHLAI